MKKSDNMMLAAACVMLYAAGIVHRPLFLQELSSVPLNDLVYQLFGNSVFALRMFSALPILAAALCIWRICRAAGAKNLLPFAPLLFLTNFFVFWSGINGGAAAFGGAFCILAMTLLFMVLTARAVWKKIVAAVGCAAALFGGIVWSVPLNSLQGFIPALFPWVFFVPVIVRKMRGRWGELRQDKLSLFAVYLTIVWSVTALVSRRPEALFPAIAGGALLLSSCICRQEAGAFDRMLNYLVGAILPLPVLFFIWQTIGRFTNWIPEKYLLYIKGENYFIPVIALTLLAVWWKAAVKEEDGNKKFLYVCAGVAFVMLALPHALPVKYLRQESVEIFITTTVQRVAPGKNVQLAAAGQEMRQAVRWSLGRDDVADYDPQKLSKECETLIFTADKNDVKKLPHPKSYYTNGKFYMIHNPERSLK